MKRLTLTLLFLCFLIAGAYFLYNHFGWITETNNIERYTISHPTFFRHAGFMDGINVSYYRYSQDTWYTGELGGPGGGCYRTGEDIELTIELTKFSLPPEKLVGKGMRLNTTSKPIRVAGIQTIEYTFKNGNGVWIGPFIRNDKQYRFAYNPPCIPPKNYHFPQHLDVFHKMINSFNFTN